MGITEKEQTFQRNVGFFAFFLNGICAINSDVIVSTLQEIYGFTYGVTGTLLSLMSIGNLSAGFASDMLPTKIGTKKTVVLPTAGYGIGYVIVSFSGWMLVLVPGFFTVNVAKGSTISICTILVADNSGDRTKSMNIIHSCYASSALLYPFFIAAAMRAGNTVSMLVLAACGFLLQLTLCVAPAEARAMKKDWNIDKSFLESRKFWMLTGLLFCQSAAEVSVTGWMVTCFEENGIISRSLSPYTVTVMQRAALTARLLIAFVIPIKDSYSTMIRVGIGCIIFYMGLMMASIQTTATPLLFAFAFVMASMNPTTVTSTGRVTSVASMGIMLPAASSGATIMPWVISIMSEYAGIEIGMASNIIPCAGMLLFSVAVERLKEQEL